MILRIFFCVLLSGAAEAQMNSTDEEALRETITLLKDKAARDTAIAKDGEAKKADAYTKQVAGQNSEEVYGLSAKVFEKLVLKYGSDMTKLQEVLQRALKDPKGFVDSEFGPEEVRALKDLADRLPADAAKK